MSIFHFSILLQLLFFFLGGFIALNVLKNRPDIDFDNAHKESKPMLVISLIILTLLTLGAVTVRFDAILEMTPILYQRFAIVYSWTMIAVFIGFVSGYVIFLAYKLKKRFKTYLPSLLLLNTLFYIVHYQTNNYVGDRVGESKRFDGGFLQTTNYSCTSASLATVATHFGLNVDERTASELLRVTKFGANLGQIRYALHRLGVGYESLRGQYKELKDVKPPAILFVNHPSVGVDGHAVVYFGLKDDGKYKIWDPLKGKIELSQKDIKDIWNGNGIRCFKVKNRTESRDVNGMSGEESK